MGDDDRQCHQILKASLVGAPSWTSGIGANESDTDDSKLDEPSASSQDSPLANQTCSSSSSSSLLANQNHQPRDSATARETAQPNDFAHLSISVPTVYLARKNPSSSSYHIYQIDIESSCGVGWSIYRRYSQFHQLHQQLRAQDAAIERLAFPPKRRINSKTSTIVQDRRLKLENYLRSLCCYIEKSRPDVDRDTDAFYQFLSYSSKASENLEQHQEPQEQQQQQQH